MSTISAKMDLDITRLKEKINTAKNEIKSYKASSKKEVSGISDSVFGGPMNGSGASAAVSRAARSGAMRGAGGEGGGAAGLASLAGIGGPVTATLAGLAATAVGIKAVANAADELWDASLKLNETPETVQRVGAAAKLSGSSIEGLSGSVLKLEKNLGDVENVKAKEALEAYGLTAEQLAAMPLDEKILALSGAFQKARVTGTGYKELLDLIGKSGADLIPLLANTSDEIQSMFDRANVISNDNVARLAQNNDRIDEMFNNLKASISTSVGESIHFLEILSDWVGGKSLGEIGAADAENTAALQAKMNQRGEDKKTMADGIKAANDAKAAEELGKTTADFEKKAAADRVKAAEQVLDLEEKINSIRTGGTPGDQLAGLQKSQQAIFDGMKTKGGAFFDPSNAGLEKWADKLKAAGKNDEAVKVLEMLEKSLAISKEMAAVTDSMRDTAASEAKAKQDKVDALRKETDDGALKMLSSKEQAAQLREQLGASLGLKVNSASDVSGGLAKLKQEADAAGANGDKDLEAQKLEQLKKAQEQAGQLAGLSANSVAPARVAGETAGALSILSGSGSTDLVLDESKQQTQSLKNIETALRAIDTNTKPSTGHGLGHHPDFDL